MTARPLRILVGTVEVAGMLTAYAEAFRKLGHHVTTAVAGRNSFYSTADYDVDIGRAAPDIVRWPDAVARSASPFIRIPRGAVNRAARAARLLSLIENHDVFVFTWGGVSLTSGHREFPLLKRRGKKIVSVFMGSDVRHVPAYQQQFDALSSSADFLRALAGRSSEAMTNPRGPWWNMRVAERYADVIYSQPNQSGLAIRPYRHLFLPLPVEQYRCRIPGREVPVLVHAPSNADTKGTGAILAALDRLRAEGVAFELRLLQGVPNERVLSELGAADVAVDQLYCPYHGKFSAEAMASGCAVATCNREDYEPFPPKRPICHIDVAGIVEQLRALLMHRHLRISLAEQGRKYIEDHHSDVNVARGVLDALGPSTRDRPDHYPTFLARTYRPAHDESMAPALQRMTTRIAQRWGLPPDVDPGSLVVRGLMASAAGANAIPRWKPPADPVDAGRG